MAMTGWAAQELRTLRLGDPRRDARVITMLEWLGQQPEASIPQAMGTWAATKAAYRCLDNGHIDATAILAAHQAAIRERAAGEPVLLAIQDTTEVSYGTHRALAGQGPLSRPGHQGVLLHTILLTTDAGVPLGVLDHHVWTRDATTTGKARQRRSRPTAEKESQRWLDGATRTWEALTGLGAMVVVIADREGDIFDFLAQDRPAWGHLLVRSTHERKLADGLGHLSATIAAAPVLGRMRVKLGRRDHRPPRTVTLALRAVAVTLAPPHRRAGDGVKVTVIQASEIRSAADPETEPPIDWLLTTTLPGTTRAAVRRAVRWYARRWLIERYHYVLKQGCAIEALQLETVARLERALALYAIVAWRLLWLTHLARRAPDTPCTSVLSAQEWTILWQVVEPDHPLPTGPPTLAEAVRLIARLGGFLARRRDGDPGVKTIWRGWRRLQDIMTGATLTQTGLVGNA